ncbi:MAG: sulfotransferase domain-containing protein [Promethearchaeota archaeon]
MESLINKIFFLPLRVRIKLIQLFRKLSRNTRILPDFVIIGAMKCGTSSLINYLTQHPYIKIPLFQKEVHFFDRNFDKGINWYRSFFPSRIYKYIFTKIKKRNFLTGEKSPLYIFHPLVPKRLYKTLPNSKIILLLRNPVNRAYSHYNHSVRNGRDKLTFEEAIKLEPERLKGEKNKILKFKNYRSIKYSSYSYLSRGHYLEQIKEWRRYFPKQQILIIKSEDLFKTPQVVMNKVYDFLNIPRFKHQKFKKIFSRTYQKMNEETKQELVKYFKPYNEKLYEYLNENFGWEEE